MELGATITFGARVFGASHTWFYFSNAVNAETSIFGASHTQSTLLCAVFGKSDDPFRSETLPITSWSGLGARGECILFVTGYRDRLCNMLPKIPVTRLKPRGRDSS